MNGTRNNPIKQATITVPIRMHMVLDPFLSPLQSAGEIAGRAGFVHDNEERIGTIVISSSREQIFYEVRGMGIVSVSIADLVHHMMHALCGDSHNTCPASTHAEDATSS